MKSLLTFLTVFALCLCFVISKNVLLSKSKFDNKAHFGKSHGPLREYTSPLLGGTKIELLWSSESTETSYQHTLEDPVEITSFFRKSLVILDLYV
eukprot:UN26015